MSRLETGSGVLADAIDIPPMSLREARASFDALRRQASDLPPAEDLAALFREMQTTAQREGRSLTDVSAALGLAAARAGIELGNVHIFDFYRDALARSARRDCSASCAGWPRRTSRARGAISIRGRPPTPIDSCGGWTPAARSQRPPSTHSLKFVVNLGKAREWVPRRGYGWDRERVRMGTTPDCCGDRSLTVALTADRPRSDGFAATPVAEEPPDRVCGRLFAAAAGGDRGDPRRDGRRRSRAGARRPDRDRRSRRQRPRHDPRRQPESAARAGQHRPRAQDGAGSAKETLDQFSRAHPNLYGLFLFDQQGKLVASTGLDPEQFRVHPPSPMRSIARSSSGSRASRTPCNAPDARVIALTVPVRAKDQAEGEPDRRGRLAAFGRAARRGGPRRSSAATP